MVTIAWDVDDVLNDLMREWFDVEWKGRRPETRVSYCDLRANPPHEILGISRQSYLDSLDSFRAGRQYSSVRPLSEVQAWFREHGSKYRHIAVTAVPFRFAHQSSAWVIENFGHWIRTFHFVPSPRMNCRVPTYDTKKREFLSWFGQVDFLVDDNPENITDADSVGVKGIVFPRPWNQHSGVPISDALDLVTSLASKKERETR